MSKPDSIRDAATVIVVRDVQTSPRVLMGQRSAQAVFMPEKFVFPGGAVDPDDDTVSFGQPMSQECAALLQEQSDLSRVPAIAAAAIRELFEETGQILGVPGQWLSPPKDWEPFAATGYVPNAAALQFVFRAVTPPGQPRRFDARFFLVDADALCGDPDDFSLASDELSQLQWIEMDAARHFDLPFVTEIVLSEVEAILPEVTQPTSVPFCKAAEDESVFQQLSLSSRAVEP